MGMKSRESQMRQPHVRSMDDLWGELRQLDSDQFCAPASEETVRALEKKLRRPLPSDYRRFLRLADGQPEDAKFDFVDYSRLLSAEEVWSWHSVWCEQAAEFAADAQLRADIGFDGQEVDAAIQPSYFCSGWIPIGIGVRGRDWLCLDMEPTPKGSAGQVISHSVECHDRVLMAASFGVLLENYLATLKSG